ncbi:MAG TPA: hypothetical protein VGM06_20055 [Polyangiaceae bacterium]|jgi:hypothetical protein
MIAPAPPPAPPPPVHVCGCGQSDVIAHTCAVPIGHVAWQVRPPAPPVQHTMPDAQLVAVQGSGTQVITPPAPTQFSLAPHSAADEQSCVAPVAQEVSHVAVVPAPPRPAPASGTGFGVRQQTCPVLQLAALAHEATVVAPVGQALADATHVLVAAAPPPPPAPAMAGTVQHVRVGLTQTPAPQGTSPVAVVLTGAPSGLPAPLLLVVPLELPPEEDPLLAPVTPLLELEELELPGGGLPLSLVLDPPQAAASATPTETTKKIRAPFIKATSRGPESAGT